MNAFVSKYFPNAIEMDRVCKCCNHTMFTVKYKHDYNMKITSPDNVVQRLYEKTAQCFNNDCLNPEVESLEFIIE